MKQKRNLKGKLLSFLLTLAMVVGLLPGMGMTVQAAPTEALLTTITPTGIDTYSESTAGVVNVALSDITRYTDGRWAYGGTVTVTPVMGYTITKCRFNAKSGAVDDTEAPFSINVRDVTYVGAVEVYGYATPTATHSVTITAGDHMTKTAGSGDAEQTGLTGAMTPVVYTADNGYYFPKDYSVAEVSGIKVTCDSYTQITVSGTPKADAAIVLTAPTAKETPAAPTTAAAVDCTTSDNNDGKLTGVTTAMEYKKSDAADWTAGTGSDITGLVPGTYYVRLKATETTNASTNQELTINVKTVPPKKPQTVGKTTIRNTMANSAKKTNDVVYDAVSGATGYDIAYKHKNSGKWVIKSTGKQTRATIGGLSIGGMYQIKVRAKKAETAEYKAATGAWSPVVYRYFHTTQKTRLASKAKKSFTMSWSRNAKATGYQVMFSTNKNGAGAAKNINTVGKNATSFTKTGLKSGVTYYVQVRELVKIGNVNYIGNISKPVAVKIK